MDREKIYEIQKEIENSNFNRKDVAKILCNMSIEDKMQLKELYEEQNQLIMKDLENCKNKIEVIRREIFNMKNNK